MLQLKELGTQYIVILTVTYDTVENQVSVYLFSSKCEKKKRNGDGGQLFHSCLSHRFCESN